MKTLYPAALLLQILLPVTIQASTLPDAWVQTKNGLESSVTNYSTLDLAFNGSISQYRSALCKSVQTNTEKRLNTFAAHEGFNPEDFKVTVKTELSGSDKQIFFGCSLSIEGTSERRDGKILKARVVRVKAFKDDFTNIRDLNREAFDHLDDPTVLWVGSKNRSFFLSNDWLLHLKLLPVN